MFARQFVALVLISATLTACPESPTFVTTDDASTGATTAGAPTTSTSTSTGDTASPTTSDASTGAAPIIDCGKPAEECAPSVRDWCDDMQNLCAGTALAPVPGSGETDYCEVFATMCDAGATPCQLCNYLLNTCNQLGGGDDCSLAAAECLCLATTHNLDI